MVYDWWGVAPSYTRPRLGSHCDFWRQHRMQGGSFRVASWGMLLGLDGGALGSGCGCVESPLRMCVESVMQVNLLCLASKCRAGAARYQSHCVGVQLKRAAPPRALPAWEFGIFQFHKFGDRNFSPQHCGFGLGLRRLCGTCFLLGPGYLCIASSSVVSFHDVPISCHLHTWSNCRLSSSAFPRTQPRRSTSRICRTRFKWFLQRLGLHGAQYQWSQNPKAIERGL
mmetsp:Transcript_13954/g.30871  ORF Transcript_13954/g.30871 Transcript_13954/m.30871 type:complete len:226 (+) Transcript_13954:253-930(+)